MACRWQYQSNIFFFPPRPAVNYCALFCFEPGKVFTHYALIVSDAYNTNIIRNTEENRFVVLVSNTARAIVFQGRLMYIYRL